jgi:hypothetical protein
VSGDVFVVGDYLGKEGGEERDMFGMLLNLTRLSLIHPATLSSLWSGIRHPLNKCRN